MILEDVQALNMISPTLHTVYCKLSAGSLRYLGILLQICKMIYTYKMLIFIENVLTMKYRKRKFLWIQYLKAGFLKQTMSIYIAL